jgi:predicted dehydrogenase
MNPDSRTVDEFGDRHNIAETYKGDAWKDMISEAHCDGIVIATHVDGLAEALEASVPRGVPILVEKPVAWRSTDIQRLRKNSHENVIVNYHRRHYQTVNEANKFLRDHRPVLGTLELPETDLGLRVFLRKSCHGIDMLRYLFGDLQIVHSEELVADDVLLGFISLLKTGDGDLINVVGNWRASANKRLSLDCNSLRFEVKPYEQARTYDGFNLEPPTPDTHYKRFIPEVTNEYEIESHYDRVKPGFYDQALILRKLMNGYSMPQTCANLKDAEEAIKLCERLLPNHLPLPSD